jgi:hypothetical protein
VSATTPTIGATVQYCGHDATFIADIYVVEGVAVVRAATSHVDRNLQRPARGATHHIVDFPKAGFWRPDLGVFVVPLSQVRRVPS